MLKQFLTAAVLGLSLGLCATTQADAAAVSPVTGLDQTQKAVDSTLTPVHGGGWWAVPVVIGGVILFDELHRRTGVIIDFSLPRTAAATMSGEIQRDRVRALGKSFYLGFPENTRSAGTVKEDERRLGGVERPPTRSVS